MKASDVTISVNNRAFVQYFTFDQEDGLPEGYTLHLEHTDKPQDPPEGTVYKNGDWGCWGTIAEPLTLSYHKESDGKIFDESIVLDAPTALSWLDILDGIILYSSTEYRYANFVLYNVEKRIKKVITANDYIKNGKWDLIDFDHFREPTLWVQDGIVYVWFEAVDGWYDGGENVGKKIMCFKKDTLEQLKPSNCPLDMYDIDDALEDNRGKDYGTYKSIAYNINLYPGRRNKYGKEDISEMCHRTEHGDGKYKEFPKSLIKWMRKVRLEYAKSIDAKIEGYSLRPHIGKDFWELLESFARKIEHWAWEKHSNKLHRRSECAKKKEARKNKK